MRKYTSDEALSFMLEFSGRKFGWKVRIIVFPIETRFFILVTKVKNTCGGVSAANMLRLSMMMKSYRFLYISRKFLVTLKNIDDRNWLHLPPSTCNANTSSFALT